MIILRFLEQLSTNQFSADDHIRMGWWMLSMPLLGAIAIHTPMAIARHWHDRKRMAIYSGGLFTLVFFGADLAYYAEGAYVRASVNPAECRVEVQRPYGPYEALVCVTGGTGAGAADEGFVHLRSTQDGSVLAIREFYNPSYNRVYWGKDELSIGIADGSARFDLPPTRWDRLRAKLP